MATIYWIGSDGGGGGSDWNDTTNWSGGAVPVNSDVVYIDRTSDSITTNLNQSAVTLNGLFITSNFTGTIGNAPDATDEFLQIAVSSASGNVVIGEGDGNGSARLNLDFGTTATNIDIRNTQTTGTDDPKAPLRIKCDNSSCAIQVNGDNANVAFNDDADLSSKDMGAVTVFNASSVYLGPGSVYTTFDQLAGNVLIDEAQGTHTIQSGTLQLEGTTAITAITQTGGTVIQNSTGTITTYTARGGTLDLQQSAFARTITTLTKSPGFVLRYDDNVTITNDNLDTAYQQPIITVS
jgi:hypothetical protein